MKNELTLKKQLSMEKMFKYQQIFTAKKKLQIIRGLFCNKAKIKHQKEFLIKQILPKRI